MRVCVDACMCGYMYVLMRVYVDACMRMRVCVDIYVLMRVCVDACMCGYMCVVMHVCAVAYTCRCVYVLMYVCVGACMRMGVYVDACTCYALWVDT